MYVIRLIILSIKIKFLPFTLVTRNGTLLLLLDQRRLKKFGMGIELKIYLMKFNK